jgi:hypothetical protein
VWVPEFTFYTLQHKKDEISNKIVKIGYAPLELIEARKEIEGTNAELAEQRIDSKILKKKRDSN